MILYHATYLAYLPSILEEGLVPGRHANWDGEENEGLIFMSTDDDTAYSFCETADLVSDDIYNSGIVLVHVDTEMIDSSLMEHDPNMLEEVMPSIAYRGTISAEAFANLGELLSLL